MHNGNGYAKFLAFRWWSTNGNGYTKHDHCIANNCNATNGYAYTKIRIASTNVYAYTKKVNNSILTVTNVRIDEGRVLK